MPLRAAQQLVHGDIKVLGDGEEHLNVRRAAALPLGDGLHGDANLLPQLRLRQIAAHPQLPNFIADLIVFHSADQSFPGSDGPESQLIV